MADSGERIRRLTEYEIAVKDKIAPPMESGELRSAVMGQAWEVVKARSALAAAEARAEAAKTERDNWKNYHDGQVAGKRRLSKKYGELLAEKTAAEQALREIADKDINAALWETEDWLRKGSIQAIAASDRETGMRMQHRANMIRRLCIASDEARSLLPEPAPGDTDG